MSRRTVVILLLRFFESLLQRISGYFMYSRYRTG